MVKAGREAFYLVVRQLLPCSAVFPEPKGEETRESKRRQVSAPPMTSPFPEMPAVIISGAIQPANFREAIT